MVCYLEFQKNDSVHREQEHEIPRVLLPVDELGVAVQELCAEVSQGYPSAMTQTKMLELTCSM